MRVAIATVQCPFLWGGAEALARGLKEQFQIRGHTPEIITFPFKPAPAEVLIKTMMAAELFDYSEFNGQKMDLLVTLKFPAFYCAHENRVSWVLHQHRAAYDLWDTPFKEMNFWRGGEALRALIFERDRHHFLQNRKTFTISKLVSDRMSKFNGIESKAIYHPPEKEEDFFCDSYGDFIYFPSRISPIKRQRLLVEAMRQTKSDIKVVMSGPADGDELEKVQKEIANANLGNRVILLGPVSHEEKIRLYATCKAVYFGAFNEDYGYVTLEAMLSGKAVIIHTDAGGPFEFIQHSHSGYVIEPNAASLASLLDQIADSGSEIEKMGQRALQEIKNMNISWDNVISELTT